MLDKFQTGLSPAATVIIVLIILIGGVAIAYYSGQDQNEPETQEETVLASPDASQGGEEDAIENKDDAMMEDKEDDAMIEDGSMSEDGQGDAMPAPQPPPSQPSASPPAVAETKTFNLTGQNFAFSQTEILVKKGDKVIINFESTGGFHDFTLDGYGVGTQSVNPGTKTSVEFVADQAGTFEYFCSVGNHRQMGMTGRLIVE